MWTKRYLGEQLLVALAGRAGEEIVYGRDEMSSLSQSRNMLARQIATKIQNAGGRVELFEGYDEGFRRPAAVHTPFVHTPSTQACRTIPTLTTYALLARHGTIPARSRGGGRASRQSPTLIRFVFVEMV